MNVSRTVTDLRRHASSAAEGILARRTRPEDPDLERFPGVDDLEGVVRYVARYQRVSGEVLAADALAQLQILRYLTVEMDRLRLGGIRLARKSGCSWRSIAHPLGVTSPQGAEQTMLRLQDYFDGHDGTRSEVSARSGRSHEPSSGPRRLPGRRLIDELRAAVGQLVDAIRVDRHLSDDDVEWVVGLHRDREIADAQYVNQLGLAVEDLPGLKMDGRTQDALAMVIRLLKK